jgi:hypothetical protein
MTQTRSLALAKTSATFPAWEFQPSAPAAPSAQTSPLPSAMSTATPHSPWESRLLVPALLHYLQALLCLPSSSLHPSHPPLPSCSPLPFQEVSLALQLFLRLLVQVGLRLLFSLFHLAGHRTPVTSLVCQLRPSHPSPDGQRLLEIFLVFQTRLPQHLLRGPCLLVARLAFPSPTRCQLANLGSAAPATLASHSLLLPHLVGLLAGLLDGPLRPVSLALRTATAICLLAGPLVGPPMPMVFLRLPSRPTCPVGLPTPTVFRRLLSSSLAGLLTRAPRSQTLLSSSPAGPRCQTLPVRLW